MNAMKLRSPPPESHDWRRTSKVFRDVQDQKNCGSCWGFAGIAAVEGQMDLLESANDKLSEQEIIECGSLYIVFHVNDDFMLYKSKPCRFAGRTRN